jgi:hypothetical protein
LSFEFRVVILKKDLFCDLFFWFFLDFFLSLSRVAIVAELVEFFQILKGCYFTDIVLDAKMDIFIIFRVSVSQNLGVQVLVNLFEFALAQFFNYLIFLFSEHGKVSAFGFPFKVSEVLLVKTLPSQSILDFF